MNTTETIRKAVPDDIEKIEKIYNEILENEKNTPSKTGWIKGVYPTGATAKKALQANELFVMELDKKVVAAATINKVQVPEYKSANWKYIPENDDSVMVIHTLVVSPDCNGKGCGSRFISFYEDFARQNNCRFLRMDTNKTNTAARSLYKKLGYSEVGIVSCDFNNIPDVQLVCLEKKL